jgi:hypothetical protein
VFIEALRIFKNAAPARKQAVLLLFVATKLKK